MPFRARANSGAWLLTRQAFRAAIASLLSATAVAFFNSPSSAAEQAASQTQNTSGSDGSNADQDPKNNNTDLTSPENSLDLRFRVRESSSPASETDRDSWIIRGTSRIKLDPDWKLSLFAQTEVVEKSTSTEGVPGSEDNFGLGNTQLQAILIRKLSDSSAFGFGARLVAPTAQDDIGNGKWVIMPGFGVRYTFTELSSDTYFVPAMRYAVSFAGDPKTRNISEPQIAPTFNLNLPGPWFLTFYPSYDIRINYGDPVSGQTGRLFLPADVALGYELNDHIVMSLEVSVPIIKDYPVYDFKTEFRVVIKN